MTVMPRSRLAALASVGVLVLGGLTAAACGSDDSEESPATTECVSTDTSTPGEQGSSNTTVVGDVPDDPGARGGSAGATENEPESGANSGAGDAPDPSIPSGEGDSTTGNADTGSGGSSRTC